MTNGILLYPENRPIKGLKSKYATDWESLFLGFQSTYSFPSNVNVNTLFRYHFLEYGAVADWNLRTDLAHPVSFRHSGYGQGAELKCGISYLINNWRLTFSYNHVRFKIKDGQDRLFFSTGSMVKSRLNEVEWRSQSLSFEIGYIFQ